MYGDGAVTSHFVSAAKPNGYFMLPIAGRLHTVIGGPFDAFNGGFGVCLEKHSSKADQADILVDWPDFGVISRGRFFYLIYDMVEFALHRPDAPIMVGCRGGIGRTGTVLAGLVKAVGAGGKDPVGFVRKNYLSGAVETDTQRKLVANLDVGPMRVLIAKHEMDRNSHTGFFQSVRRLFSWS
jgi:hypothetical protein